MRVLEVTKRPKASRSPAGAKGAAAAAPKKPAAAARPERGIGSALEPDVRELLRAGEAREEQELDRELVNAARGGRGWLSRRRRSWRSWLLR